MNNDIYAAEGQGQHSGDGDDAWGGSQDSAPPDESVPIPSTAQELGLQEVHDRLMAERRSDLVKLMHEAEQKQRMSRGARFMRHNYLFAVADDDDGIFSYVQLAINYVRSGLFLVVLGYIMLYFVVQLTFTGFFHLFPEMEHYFVTLRFGEASLLVGFVIGFIFNINSQQQEDTFKARPRAATSIFHQLSLMSDDVESLMRVPSLPDEARLCLVEMAYSLHALTTHVMFSFYAAESHKKKLGNTVIAEVRAHFGMLRKHYRQAKAACDLAGVPHALPDSFGESIDRLRTEWVDSTLYLINYRGHRIAMMHVNFWVNIYLFFILPAQTFGALDYFGLIVYPLTMLIFNIQRIVYEFLGNPFNAQNQNRLQSSDFVKTERAHRMHVAANALRCLRHVLEHQLPPSLGISSEATVATATSAEEDS